MPQQQVTNLQLANDNIEHQISTLSLSTSTSSRLSLLTRPCRWHHNHQSTHQSINDTYIHTHTYIQTDIRINRQSSKSQEINAPGALINIMSCNTPCNARISSNLYTYPLFCNMKHQIKQQYTSSSMQHSRVKVKGKKNEASLSMCLQRTATTRDTAMHDFSGHHGTHYATPVPCRSAAPHLSYRNARKGNGK